jgi:glycosyltransferase involved in cell wall biosynthesis
MKTSPSSNKNKKIKVCYILSYRCPNYVRTKTLIAALKRMDNVVLFEAINTTKGIFRYIQTLSRLLAIRMTKKPDYYILGFRGYEIFWIVRILALGTPLIFDYMMSPYDSLLNERKIFKKGGPIEKLIYLYEKSILKYSDEKIYALHVGTDENLFKNLPSDNEVKKKDFFEVFFYGTFLPLHGIDIILKAASIVKDRPIRFTLIGGKKKYLLDFYEIKKRLKLKNVIHKERVDYEQLPSMISESDLCLGGPFGNTGQARRVVSGKTFQFLAMGKPTIVGKIDAYYGFEDKKNCLLVPQGNEKKLANTILWCFENQKKLGEIGQRGLELYRTKFSIDHIKEALQVIFLS